MSAYDPDDLRTHYAAWRKALVIARDNAEVSPPDIDDRSYWQHELDVFDRTLQAITGGPDGNRILGLQTVKEPASEAKTHPHGPGGWWRSQNPWDDRAIYVSVPGLAEALGYHRVPGHWLSQDGKLDAYILPQPDGTFVAGVRYGPEGHQYISPYANLHQDALRELATSVAADAQPMGPGLAR